MMSVFLLEKSLDMKKFLFVLFTLFSIALFAQTEELPAYKKQPGIPQFMILQPDSTWFTTASLPKNKPVVITYFSPECSHCQFEAKELVKHMDELKDINFVWTSYFTPGEIREFVDKYVVKKFDNVHFGRDTKYYIPVFYDLKYTPFSAVYDKHGKLVKTYDMGIDFKELKDLVNAEK